MTSKRDRKASQNSENLTTTTINELVEEGNMSMCSFAQDFVTYCVEELVDFIPEISILSIEKSPLGSLTVEKPGLLPSVQGSSMVDVTDVEKRCEEKRPKIDLLYENPAKCENLRMISVKGLSMEPGVLKAIGKSLSLQPTLTTLKLENCNLNYLAVELIAGILLDTLIIKDLSLSGNPILEMNYFILLHDTSLQHLNLSQCAIGNDGARWIANELVYDDASPQTLLTLNLTHNHIGDVGAQYLAIALRTNRTLVSLSLAGNRIQDGGAIALAGILQKFPLWHQECVDKRYRKLLRLLQRKNLLDELIKEYKELHPSEVVEETPPKLISTKSGTPSMKSRSGTKDQKKDSKKKGGTRGKSASAKDTRAKESPTPLPSKTKCPSVPSAELKKMEEIVDSSLEEDLHPYMQEVKAEDGSLWCTGNFQLAHLNLAYNRIGLPGTVAFHAAVIYQDKLLQDTRRGLLRLTLQGNPIPESCSELTEILELTNHRYYSFPDNLPSGSGELKKSSSSLNRSSSGVKRRSGSRQSVRRNSGQMKSGSQIVKNGSQVGKSSIQLTKNGNQVAKSGSQVAKNGSSALK